MCSAGTAPSSLTEQTLAGAPGTARPGTPASSSSGGGPGTLVPVEEDWHLVPPDISRDPHLSEHILPQQELREQEQVVKIFAAQALHLACLRRLLGHWQGLFSAASADWELWASGQSPLSPPELQRQILPRSFLTHKPAPTLFQ